MRVFFSSLFCSLLSLFSLYAQDQKDIKKAGHENTNKFRQLHDKFTSPNIYRNASGAPGVAYYQQQADYKMNVVLDDENTKLSGFETITYTNNSPDALHYLWVQLDQNVRAKDSKSPLIEAGSFEPAMRPSSFVDDYVRPVFDGGFNIEEVKDDKGAPLPYIINRTMMRVDLPKPLKSGDKYSFSIKWWYIINNHVIHRDRSGYEFFPEDNNRAYVMAQFYPRMAVYSDVEGWQNAQFWGDDEFALNFGDFEVDITVPSDHVLDGTGELINRKEVFTKTMMRRYEAAKKSYDKPVLIVTQEEAEAAEKTKFTTTKTWKLRAKNVRDFGFATSRKFIWDMMAVKLGNKDVMAVSMYPKEGNPLWEDWSTKAVASTLKSYSRMTFDYPYHKAISVHAKNQGMEYPMICWNYGRPKPDGTYSDRVKYGMMGVIIHEVGHNFFPMIVNSDERKWTWMDEGLNTFVQYIAEQDFGKWYPNALSKGDAYFPSDRGPAEMIIPYMGGNQDFIAPIMTRGSDTYQFGNNAYGKPATALNILRETVMGSKLFDFAFKTYAQRWMFKHPTPEDFFRTMEDASAFDLDWYWRGWFYTTDWVDIGIKDIKRYYITSTPNQYIKDYLKERGKTVNDLIPLVYTVEEGSSDFKKSMLKDKPLQDVALLKDYMQNNFTAEERNKMEAPNYFYEIVFEKPGGLVMPIIAEFKYKDGTTKRIKYPAQIWSKNDKEIKKTIASRKEIIGVVIDPDKQTADIDTANNSWPRAKVESDFDTFKSKLKK